MIKFEIFQGRYKTFDENFYSVLFCASQLEIIKEEMFIRTDPFGIPVTCEQNARTEQRKLTLTMH